MLLRGTVGKVFEQHVARAPAGTVRRTILQIEPPELAALPWELMRHGELLLSTNVDAPLSRAVELETDDDEQLVPIRLLVVEGAKDETTNGDIGSRQEIEGIVASRPAFYGGSTGGSCDSPPSRSLKSACGPSSHTCCTLPVTRNTTLRPISLLS